MRVILLIMIGASLLLASDVLFDSRTGLTWQNNSVVKSTKVTWYEAKSYCSNLNLAGHNDWRLPDIKALESIVDVMAYRPSIKKGFKHVNTTGFYWSSSSVQSDNSFATIMRFEFGEVGAFRKGKELGVRCVRGRQ